LKFLSMGQGQEKVIFLCFCLFLRNLLLKIWHNDIPSPQILILKLLY
jgi:hypothetical protein